MTQAVEKTDALKAKPVYLNLGPSHPTMHGTLRLFCELDGEIIKRSIAEFGYLHRGFEKHAENSTWTQVIPYTDRLNYVSAMMNNVGYCKAVEELLDLEIPERAQTIRVIVCEMNRIIDHLVCTGTNLVDIGALTNFWYYFNVRERFYNIIEQLCGARLTTAYTRIGGLMRDLYPGFEDEMRACLKDLAKAIEDVTGLLNTNKIFLNRTIGVGPISKEDAIRHGFTGPCLRATGVGLDLRKAQPYYGYENYDFEVVVGEHGDSYDRIVVRFEEMKQSARIIEQAMAKLKPGPIMTDDKRVALPPKAEVYTNIEALMNHFKLIYEGIRPPVGEVYSATEAANGELGFYIVSDGSGTPYRVKCRPPCFPIFQAYPMMVEGKMLADAIAILGNLNIIAGELDR
ncbi:MAG: NADH-quinone oxidoreductase subunit D [Deltaproteobacteria bacterium]|nr:NADH-quinone oxidoreductase subunit D [Deltaproteobacteria bacterium]